MGDSIKMRIIASVVAIILMFFLYPVLIVCQNLDKKEQKKDEELGGSTHSLKVGNVKKLIPKINNSDYRIKNFVGFHRRGAHYW